MSSPEPIPPPNDRRGSRASSSAAASVHDMVNGVFPVGGPPSSPSPLQIRASNSFNSKNRKRPVAKQPPDFHLLEYLAPPDSNLVCLICHSPFCQPVQLPCNHYFCRQCLDHACDAQRDADKSCPMCRSKLVPARDIRPVPKLIETMLDELLVKCPNSKSGCAWVDQRVNVHDHVMLYCEHTLVECPLYDCRLHISQKDFHKGCLHYTVSCDQCHTSLMKKDLEEHQRTTCPNRSTVCPHCALAILHLDLKAHLRDSCEKTIVPCQGTIVGCSFTAERIQTVAHESACAMATMAPHFRDQQTRIERNEARLEPLARKVTILEDGLSNITNMLYPASGNDSSFPVTNPLDPNTSEPSSSTVLIPTPDFRLPPASFPLVPPADTSQPNPAQPPFDSQIHHLLTLHDTLREEVSRVTNALTELEGRTNMMVINESQRVKDEMLHTNAAINGMRMQLHWLMSATLHSRSSSSAGSAAARAGPSTSASPSPGRATQSPTASLGTRPGPSATLHAPPRRLSDSTRQDVKL